MDIHQKIRITQDTSNYIEIFDHKGNAIGGADCSNEKELKKILWDILKPSECKVGLSRIRGE